MSKLIDISSNPASDPCPSEVCVSIGCHDDLDRVGDEALELELTILMPCLNEARTIVSCISAARQFLSRVNVSAEILIADNGSTDGSPELAEAAGARVFKVRPRGYGAAIIGGTAAARGRFVILGDADGSYDFRHLDEFLSALRGGAQLVMGNRFLGGIAQGAMPVLHRYIGNPILSGIGRLFFPSAVHDFHCGLRGFDRKAILSLGLCTPGMELASEMVVKATIRNLEIAEVATTLAPDGRGRPPHLRSWRDGWRHLRLLLIFSPRWLFLYPGLAMATIGLSAMLWLQPATRVVGGASLGIHTLLFAGVATVLGVQAVTFALFAKLHVVRSGLLPWDERLARFTGVVTLERGLLAGAFLLLAGIAASAWALWQWRAAGLGSLVPEVTMRTVIPAATAMLVGAQITLGAFLLEVLQWGERTTPRP